LLLTAAVPAEIAAASDVEAFVTSDCRASDPDERPAPVSVRVPKLQTPDAVNWFAEFVARTLPMVPAPVSVDVATFQTSDANVPNDVRVREADDQTARGIVAANEVEAVRTVAFVFASIVDTAKVIWLFVFVLIFVATDVEAAVISAASVDVAVFTMLLVFALTALVPALIADASDVEAFATSDCSAREPDVRFPSVKSRVPKLQTWDAVRPELPPELIAKTFPIVPVVVNVDVATFQTSEANEPNVVSDLAPFAQTANGIVAASDVDAVNTVAFVLALIVDIAEVICEFVFALIPAARDEDAFKTEVLTAEMAAPSDVEAVRTVALVLALIVVTASAI